MDGEECETKAGNVFLPVDLVRGVRSTYAW